jgi:hypothetical protein
MYTALTHHSHLISLQAQAVLRCNTLTETQYNAFCTVNLHAGKLAKTVESLASLRHDDLPHSVIKQIDHVVAPIQRYSELLLSGCFGNLSHNQTIHVKIILDNALDLAQLLGKHTQTAGQSKRR